MAASIDYLSIVKRAANATWKHKALWLFGFFMALGSGGGNNSSSYRSAFSNSNQQMSSLSNFNWQQYLPLIIAVAVIGFVIGIALWVLRLVSEGAVVGMAREIERGGSPGVGDGFRIGAAYWLRLLGIEVLIAIPIVIMVVVLIGIFVAILAGAGGLAALSGSSSSSSSAGAAAGLGICGSFALLGIGIIVMIPVVIVLSLIGTLAIRHAVLLDTGVVESLRRGWDMLKSRFSQVALMWLVMLVVGIVVGIAVALVALILIAPGLAAMLLNPVAGVLLFIPGALVLMFISGVIQAFTSVAWTDFFMLAVPEAA